MRTYRSFSSEETQKLGTKLAHELAKSRRIQKRALVLALTGGLGAGKTTFVRGFFRGLGLKKRAQSPTFIIMRRHSLRSRRALPRDGDHRPPFANVYHVDAYRLKSGQNLGALGFRDILADPSNIVLIEWADRAKSVLLKNAWRLVFRHGKKENERQIMIKR